MTARTIEYRRLDDIARADVNPKGHDAPGITASFKRFGFIEVITLDERTGKLVSGHGRLDELTRAKAEGDPAPDGIEVAEDGEWLAPVVRGWASADDEEATAAGIAINQLTIAGGWDIADLTVQLSELQERPLGLEGVGFSADDLARMRLELEQPVGGAAPGERVVAPSLADRFIVPPFSVFDARQGYWQDRKRHWLSLGIRSEEGRAHNLLKMSDTILIASGGGHSGAMRMDINAKPNRSSPGLGGALSASGSADFYVQKTRLETELGRTLSTQEASALLDERASKAPARRPSRSIPGALPHTQRLGNLQENLNGAPNRSVPNSHSGNDPAYYWKKQEAERAAGHELSIEEFEADWYTPDAYVGGTSIFDPVLCEIVYRWWCPEGGRVLDPFAGGSVRGVVAAMLQRDYLGIDLSAVQVEANQAQASELLVPLGRETASWLVGDSAQVLPTLEAEPFDLVFSCPPYFDLERYSDDPNDLSNAASYDTFLEGYRSVINESVARLAPDRFACFVVGDIRGPDGAYRGFVPDTIAAFADAGASFYNEIVLITAVGSLALRAARIFGGARKVAKAHQNVLVFVKGDAKAAAAACAPVNPADLVLPEPVEP